MSANGDRRRNPFPGWSEAEYQLFLGTIEQRVDAGVQTGMAAYRREHCDPHEERTGALEAVVFGRDEEDQPGLAERVRGVESFVINVRRLSWLAVGAMISALASLVVAIAAFAATR